MDSVPPPSPSGTITMAKGKKRVKKRSENGLSVSSGSSGTNIVCSASPNSRSIELGLLLSLAILSVFLFGFYESARALPDVPQNIPTLQGTNLNLAKDETTISSNRDLQQQQQKVKNRFANMVPKMRGTKQKVVVPKAKWPISVRDEDGDFETIIHPGDQKTPMSVPKFWSPPIHNGQLMSRETAMKIGSCTEPDKHGNYARGDDCPHHQRTIYLAIASYRDFQCRFTLESAFLRAKYPDRIRVGVVDQIVDGEDPPCNEPIEPCDQNPHQALCMYKDRVDVYEMEAELSIGPVFARHIGHRLYRGEYYATQNDAHITYVQDWDVDIIKQMEATNNEMGVLTTYLTDVQGSISEEGKSLRDTRPIMCNTDYEGGVQGQHLRHGSQPERVPHIVGSPQMEPYWAAGYSFSRGHFVVNVPYDMYMPMIFQGEEMSIGIRGFTIGYDYYAPERSVCFHHYAVGANAKKRNKVKHFWENSNRYAGTGKAAMTRLLGIVHMNPEKDPSTWDHTDEDFYGIGGVRTPERFYEVFGIDVVNKKTEHHLCRFVDSGKMHNQFKKLLRKDGMGVDYGQVTYKFKDPAPNEK